MSETIRPADREAVNGPPVCQHANLEHEVLTGLCCGGEVMKTVYCA